MKLVRQYMEQRDDLVLWVPLGGTSLRQLRASLDLLVAESANLDAFTRSPREHPGDYYLRVVCGRQVWTEREFFEACVVHRSLHRPMLQYVENVNQCEPWVTEMWQDYRHPSGSFALAPLCLHHKRYVPQLVEYLMRWDMDHETYHRRLIEILFRSHGPCKETLPLLAARAGEAMAQCGGENVHSALVNHGFRQWLCHHPSRLRMLARTCAGQSVAAFQRGYWYYHRRAPRSDEGHNCFSGSLENIYWLGWSVLRGDRGRYDRWCAVVQSEVLRAWEAFRRPGRKHRLEVIERQRAAFEEEIARMPDPVTEEEETQDDWRRSLADVTDWDEGYRDPDFGPPPPMTE